MAIPTDIKERTAADLSAAANDFLNSATSEARNESQSSKDKSLRSR